MKTNLLKYVMLIGGILLLVSLLLLLQDKFPSPAIFALDAVVISLIYIACFFSFGGIFSSAVRFGDKVASLGILMATDTAYTLLAIAGIVAGFIYPIAIEWQCLYQGLFLFLAVVGLYLASVSESREKNIRQQSTANGQTINTLYSEIELLRIRTNSSPTASLFQKNKVQFLSERIKFISFNPSSIASSLDKEISNEFNCMLSLLQTLPESSTKFNASLAKCETLIGERIHLRISQ